MIPNGAEAVPARRRNPVMCALALLLFVITCTAAAAPAVAAQASVNVLCYHTFLDKKKMDPYCFTIEELSSQIAQLKSQGFRFVSIGDVVSGRITGSKNVLVTIDDGNRSVYEAFLKVFRPNGIRPLLGIYPNIIDKKKYALTWDQLTFLANNGCDIAAHGYFHLKINQKLYDTSRREFNMEIYKSKQVLEEKLNRRITVFLYPFGLRTDVAVKALQDAGYRYAFTIKRGRIDLPVAAGGDGLFELPRYMVTRTSWNYCYNRLLENAGMKGDAAVAAAGGRRNRVPLAAVDPYPLMNDINPITRLEERLGERPAPVSLKLAASADSDRPDRHRKIKKKREEKAALEPAPAVAGQLDGASQKDKPRLLTPDTSVVRVEREGTLIAAPIQRVISSVRRDVLGLDVRNQDIYDDIGPRAERPVSLDVLSAGEGPDHGAVVALRGKTDRDSRGYREDLKKRYRVMHDGSQKSYDRFLDMVRGKLGRFKSKIRQYVIGNF